MYLKTISNAFRYTALKYANETNTTPILLHYNIYYYFYFIPRKNVNLPSMLC